MFEHADIKIPKDDTITLWHIREVPFIYPTKIAAEKAARKLFPSEQPDQRYARISYTTYTKEPS